MANAYIQQVVPIFPNASYQFVISLAKSSSLRAPMMSIFLLFLDASQKTLALGFALSMRTLNQPESQTGAWKTIVESTTIAPASAAYALVFIHKVPQDQSSPVLVDDIGLYSLGGGGNSISPNNQLPFPGSPLYQLLTKHIGENITVFTMNGEITGELSGVNTGYITVTKKRFPKCTSSSGPSSAFHFTKRALAQCSFLLLYPWIAIEKGHCSDFASFSISDVSPKML